MYDILIRGGTVVDGSGAPRYRADVAIEGERIVAVDRLEGSRARTELDATGCVVAPGFVDMHSHADISLPISPTADSLVHQGITTVVAGQCGLSLAPLLEETRQEVIAMLDSAGRPQKRQAWTTFGSYLQSLSRLGVSLNVVPLVGQGTVRGGVMGYNPEPPDPEQMAAMQAEVVRAMDEGAVGVSTGLIYPPGSWASTEELVAVVQPAAERGGLYFSHIRGEGDTLLEALAEAIRIGRETGAPVHVSHFKVAGRDNWEKAAAALALLDAGRAEGLDVTADMYPYLAGSSFLVSMLPEWAQGGGKEATLQRLADAETRRKMEADMKVSGFFRVAEWDTVLISNSPKKLAYEGRTIADLAAETGQSGYDWIFDALLETELDLHMIVFMMNEDNLRRALQHPAMMIGTDAMGVAAEGPMSEGKPHPREYGTYPRVLGRYVREEGILSLEDAVWKMSGFPAQKLGWSDRGVVKAGYRADLVVLDPDTVADRATYAQPHQYPVGIPHVIVNGQLVVQDARHTGARPGAILGRSF